ncbi:MAG: signal peptidase II [Synoicihabitans sp.]
MENPSSSTEPVTPETGRWDRVLAYRRLWIIAIVVLALDQLTKLWIVNQLPFPSYGPGRWIPVIDGFFHLVHVGNTGAAWSLFTGQSTWLAILALFTLGAIYYWRHALALRVLWMQVSFGMLCGGIVGNLIDRLAYGHVVDFLDFHFGSYIYPTFNIADSGIVVGVVLYFIYTMKHPTPPEAAK